MRLCQAPAAHPPRQQRARCRPRRARATWLCEAAPVRSLAPGGRRSVARGSGTGGGVRQCFHRPHSAARRTPPAAYVPPRRTRAPSVTWPPRHGQTWSSPGGGVPPSEPPCGHTFAASPHARLPPPVARSYPPTQPAAVGAGTAADGALGLSHVPDHAQGSRLQRTGVQVPWSATALAMSREGSKRRRRLRHAVVRAQGRRTHRRPAQQRPPSPTCAMPPLCTCKSTARCCVRCAAAGTAQCRA